MQRQDDSLMEGPDPEHSAKPQHAEKPKLYAGIALLMAAEFSFALATVFVKIITSSSKVQAIELSFFRFLAGFILVLGYVLVRRKNLVPVKTKYVAMRAFFNTFAVIFFFMGVQYSTVTKVNILNMTYPLFVFLLSPLINREHTSPVYYLYLLLTLAGLYFIVVPDAVSLVSSGVNIGDLMGLASGIIAGFAITSLREARKYDHSYIILFYLMAFGAAANLVLVAPVFVVPQGIILVHCMAATVLSVIGQLCITVGYRYINAAAGSLVSTSRILFAVLMGALILSENITVRIIAGGLMIVVSLAGVSGLGRMARESLFKNKTEKGSF